LDTRTLLQPFYVDLSKWSRFLDLLLDAEKSMNENNLEGTKETGKHWINGQQYDTFIELLHTTQTIKKNRERVYD